LVAGGLGDPELVATFFFFPDVEPDEFDPKPAYVRITRAGGRGCKKWPQQRRLGGGPWWARKADENSIKPLLQVGEDKRTRKFADIGTPRATTGGVGGAGCGVREEQTTHLMNYFTLCID